MNNDVKQIIYSYGADVCGIADIERFAAAPPGFSPSDLFRDCKSVIVFGCALPRGITKADSRLVYGHYNSLLCDEVDKIALRGAKALERKFGAKAVPLQSDKPCEEICIKNCKKCIEACPVRAIGHGVVNQSLCRQNAYGKTSRGFDTVDCNQCRMVCPMRYGK